MEHHLWWLSDSTTVNHLQQTLSRKTTELSTATSWQPSPLLIFILNVAKLSRVTRSHESSSSSSSRTECNNTMCSSLDQNLFHCNLFGDFTSKNALQIPGSIYSKQLLDMFLARNSPYCINANGIHKMSIHTQALQDWELKHIQVESFVIKFESQYWTESFCLVYLLLLISPWECLYLLQWLPSPFMLMIILPKP